MQLEVLGSGMEVGKSALLLSEGGCNILMDYGVKLQPEPPKYPPMIKRADGIILSHAHLDHSGGLPSLYKKSKPHLFMTDVTLDLATLLLMDSLKVSMKNGYGCPFSKNDIKHMIKNTKNVHYGEKFKVDKFSCRLFDAGHIPGSAGMLLETKNKKIFYTGDIQTNDSNLLAGCRLPEKCDVLITESTYSMRDHPSRESEEKRLLDAVEESMANDETALIPVFAVGRAQEILLILEKYANKIALDGMARTASDVISDYAAYLKNPKKLSAVLKKVNWVHSNDERDKALKKNPIIVTSAGMMGGGPAVHYLRGMAHRKASKVLFTGFLVEDSPGRNLIETSVFKNAEEQFHVHCDLQQLNLSAHTDRTGLFAIIERTKPSTVICVHGDSNEQFAKDIEERFGITAIAPNNGEVIKL